MKKKALLISGLLFLTGCAETIHELKSDPAIVGMTGFWFQLGVDASPTTGGVPLPNLKFGHGTIWRVGTSDKVTIKVGETASSPIENGSSEKTKGEASLEITTENTSRALEQQNEEPKSQKVGN